MEKSKGIIIALSMIIVLSVGIATGLVIENKTTVVNTLFSSKNGSSNEATKEAAKNESNGAPETLYTLMLPENKQITVPTSWQVTEITVNVVQLDARIPEEQGITFFAPICKQSDNGCDVEGIYPIHDKTIVRLSNGDSHLFIEERSLRATGPIGFQCEILPKDISEYTIVSESTGVDDVGLVRTQESGNWIYTPYSYNESGACMGTSGVPNYVQATIGYESYVFSGNSEDLTTVDSLMIDYLDIE